MRKVKPYLTVFRLQALRELSYRGAALGGMITQLFFGLVLIAVYSAFLTQEGADTLALRRMASYVWLQQMFFRGLLSTDGELVGQIMTGSFAGTLLRPVDQHAFFFMRNLAMKLFGSLMRFAPLLVCQVFLPESCRLLPPASFTHFLGFCVTLLLGLTLSALFHAMNMALIMVTLDRRGVSAMLNLLAAIFSGNILPLTFFPDRLQALVRYQPFAQILDLPIRVYQGEATAGGILVQLAWIAVMVVFTRALWRRNLRRIVIQGG
ncbi:MAG: ABC-2 family transporter protein [Clostridia bacterium]|nr:ABC-2 family transporter protein [Clostridia bacterium]